MAETGQVIRPPALLIPPGFRLSALSARLWAVGHEVLAMQNEY